MNNLLKTVIFINLIVVSAIFQANDQVVPMYDDVDVVVRIGFQADDRSVLLLDFYSAFDTCQSGDFFRSNLNLKIAAGESIEKIEATSIVEDVRRCMQHEAKKIYPNDAAGRKLVNELIMNEKLDKKKLEELAGIKNEVLRKAKAGIAEYPTMHPLIAEFLMLCGYFGFAYGNGVSNAYRRSHKKAYILLRPLSFISGQSLER
ncbi:hypothetical protein IPH25_03720 [bacterium]|nr:MAG: hypothetical protein IPG37_00715 [bacterium]QQR61561.1 MAG: hypothetical protein IPH25_03720 [bacterium]QQR62905.1 MAG: hypothetical protein IPH67_00235 [bacterium]